MAKIDHIPPASDPIVGDGGSAAGAESPATDGCVGGVKRRTDTEVESSVDSDVKRRCLPQSGSESAAIKWKCFRISNVPSEWSEDDLLGYLGKLDASLGNLAADGSRLSLYPACSGPDRVALLNVKNCPEYFRRIRPGESNSVQQPDSDLVIDSHFYSLTPLNNPEGSIVADVVAVTGLAGNAFGSWRNRSSNRMWLQDFLPRDVKDLRIMTYGYNTTLEGPNTVKGSMLDHQRKLVSLLKDARSSREIIG
ncbi:hypothetical protein BZA05DRAFT_179670 [Tricharina praecox]|uniref:uncharacterized protein n=1 Tax=Tricharina praecox TaxID=43433 RepID=UPI0022210D6A|nr:uncharacterized protein BZA05DRAFT_179670 [Tricharina praecox]KAI5843708.1 hypothetical protein BZA05DRAFT_179670 [Tricharina praecox]